MTIKILISALCLIYVYVAIKTIIKIHKDTKRADEILEQLIMELAWSQQRQESIEALEQEQILCKDCKHWHEWESGAGSCHRSNIMWVGSDYDDYCSFAERKEQ